MTFSNNGAENHLYISRRFIQQADEELSCGDHIQASWSAWEAVSYSLKAIAERRGWEFSQVRDLSIAIDRLAKETDNPKELGRHYAITLSMRFNSFNDYKPKEFVRLDIEDAKKLLAMLDDIESAAQTRSS